MLLCQIILTLAIQQLRVLGLVQLAALALGGLYAVLRKDLQSLLCIIAYIPGAEIVWRQVRAPVFYLAAPYLLIVLSAMAVIFVLGRLGKDARLAVLYVSLLLPATIATIRVAGAGSRELVAFALAGPIGLGTFVALTSQVKIRPQAYRRILWIILISAVGPLTIAVQSIREQLAISGSVKFSTASNFVAAGGFGPVQVSSVLSLGAMAAVLLILSEPDRYSRILAAVVASALVVQTLLTFSRGGSTSLAIALTGLALINARTRHVRNRVLLIAGVAFAVGYFLVFPWLESFTGGEFSERFSDRQSGRTTLAGNDIQIFENNIIFGVGPGMTKYQRLTYDVCQLRSDKCSAEASSHTEFTRMLGEHGIPGAISIVLMGWLAINAIKRRGEGRSTALAWILWSVSQMFYANLRIVAVPITFGLAFLTMESEFDDEPEEPGSGDSLHDLKQVSTDHGATSLEFEHPIGFGAGYGPSPSSTTLHQTKVGFGAGRGAPNLIDRTNAAADSTDPPDTPFWSIRS